MNSAEAATNPMIKRVPQKIVVRCLRENYNYFEMFIGSGHFSPVPAPPGGSVTLDRPPTQAHYIR